MWTQFWVIKAPDEAEARGRVCQSLEKWTPREAGDPDVALVRIYRGPDDLAMAETIAQNLAQIRQTVIQSHRQELSRRLQHLAHRAIGIPAVPGYVVLDEDGPRSPRPLDCRSNGVRWVVTVNWPGAPPDVDPESTTH